MEFIKNNKKIIGIAVAILVIIFGVFAVKNHNSVANRIKNNEYSVSMNIAGQSRKLGTISFNKTGEYKLVTDSSNGQGKYTVKNDTIKMTDSDDGDSQTFKKMKIDGNNLKGKMTAGDYTVGLTMKKIGSTE